MKKYSVYILILVLGLLLGYLIFGKSNDVPKTKNNSEITENTEHQIQKWTCSMHPQIMQNEPGDCPICGMELIPAETHSHGLSPNEIKMSENAMALANIQTTIVGNTAGSQDRKIILSGKIMANEKENAVQASYFAGRIEKLYVNFTGEEVQKGQLLATIYAPALVAAQQELLTAATMKTSQPSLYQAVRNKLKLWKLSENQIDQIEASGKVRENFPIYATVSGIVTKKMVEEGDYVEKGQPIVKVSDLGTVWAIFDAYENQISEVSEGQNITVTTNAYPNKEFEASISFIDPILDTKSRTVSVRATLNNKENLFKPGMFVKAAIQMSNNFNGEPQITVPATAVLWTGSRSLVYVKTNPDEPVFEMREVSLGKKYGDIYSITSGLKPSEEVVTNGTFTVDAAAQLQGKRSMMNAENDRKISSENYLEEIKRLEVPAKFQTQLKAVFDDYIKMEKALVNDNSTISQKSARDLLHSIEKVHNELLKEEPAYKHWLRLENELKESAQKIAETSDIKIQREFFVHLSAHLINALKTYGIDQTVYVKYCPMANKDVGAFWVSKNKEILNPYFGEKMLQCGTVVQEIN